MGMPSNGMNVVWCIEKEIEEPITEASCTEICFPSSEVILQLIFASSAVNNSYFLTIKTVHPIESFKMYGSISLFTSTDSISLLEEFEFDLECNSPNFVNLKELKRNSNLLDNMLLNNAVNLLIQLCNSREKKTSVTCHFVSELAKQKCNFEWVLDTQSEIHDKYVIPCHAFSTGMPRHFLFDEMKYVDVHISLYFESFCEVKNHYIFVIDTPIDICGKIKIEVKSKNCGTFDLINTEFLSGLDDMLVFPLKKEKIVELIANKHIYYPRRFLTLNISFEVISYFKSRSVEIEEIDYLSGVNNITALIERSNKFCQHALENPPENLCTSLYSLYREGQLCDVTLCVGEEKFPCHKVVLSARSPVFRTMFQNNEQEKEGNLVKIPNFNPDCFKIFLSTLYSESLNDLKWDDVWNVYEAAVEYDVPVIRKLCSNFLLSTISMVNVCQNLEFSYDHKDEYLMKEIKHFIFKHAQEVIKLSDWDDLSSRNPLLAAKVMKEIIST